MVHDLRRLADVFEHTVICSPGPGLHALRAEGIQVLEIPIERKLTPFADLASVWALWRLFRREHFDVAQGYTPKGGLLVALAGWLARVPVRLYSCRGLLYTAEMSTARRSLFRLTDRLTSALTHRTLFLSQADMEFCVRTGLCPGRKARFIGSGIDLAHFTDDVATDTAATVRSALGIPAGAPLILTVARFVSLKGYPELAHAASIVLRQRPDARFVWVAPRLTGETDVLSATLAEDWGIAQAVVRTGHRVDLPRLYAAADLLVHPSHREGVSRVLMEAAAMGVPIVATDIAGCRAVVPSEDAGWLVPVSEPQRLAQAILDALADPEERMRRAGIAKRDVRARYSLDGLASRLREVYAELFGSMPPTG